MRVSGASASASGISHRGLGLGSKGKGSAAVGSGVLRKILSATKAGAHTSVSDFSFTSSSVEETTPPASSKHRSRKPKPGAAKAKAQVKSRAKRGGVRALVVPKAIPVGYSYLVHAAAPAKRPEKVPASLGAAKAAASSSFSSSFSPWRGGEGGRPRYSLWGSSAAAVSLSSSAAFALPGVARHAALQAALFDSEI